MGMPGYNGANNSTDKLVTPWNIEGWTAQQAGPDSIQVAPGDFAPLPFPTNLIYAQVTAPYFDYDGNPLSGFVTFFMSESITVSYNGSSFRLPQRYAGRDNGQFPGGQANWGTGRIYIRRGFMSVTLMCSNNSAIVTDSGNPLTYHVVEHFMNGVQFDITVPTSVTSPVDLRSLTVPGSIQAYAYDPSFPMGNEGYTPLVPTTPPGTTLLTGIDGGNA